MSEQLQTTIQPRQITPGLLDDFEKWTREAPMFLSSPQGVAFAQEMRSVIRLARMSMRPAGDIEDGFIRDNYGE